MSDDSIVHISVGPLSDWFHCPSYEVYCGARTEGDWITNKLVEATCEPCLHAVVIGNAVG